MKNFKKTNTNLYINNSALEVVILTEQEYNDLKQQNKFLINLITLLEKLNINLSK